MKSFIESNSLESASYVFHWENIKLDDPMKNVFSTFKQYIK